MTTNKSLYNGRTTAEWEAIAADYENNVEKKKAEILERTKDIAKAAKKGDLDKLRHANHMVASAFKSLDQAEDHLKEAQGIVETSKRYDAGYGAIQEFLEEMFLKDIEWHQDLVKQTEGMTFKEIYNKMGQNESVTMLARMSEEEARKIFRQDVNARYKKLVQQIEKKVGAVKEFRLERNDNMSLDGIVIGTEAAARINTIVAGGYNIQRAHYRTLVKVTKEVESA